MKNEIIKEKYAINISQSLVDKYNEYLNYNKLNTTFNSYYEEIMKELRDGFIDYVVKSLQLTYTLDDKNSIESIDNYKQSYQEFVEYTDKDTKNKIYDALQHPILSTYPYNKKMLMDKILNPINDKRTKLEKDKADAKAKDSSGYLTWIYKPTKVDPVIVTETKSYN